ncbi:MAG: recombinase family protein [Bacteroidota bacterium]
MVKIKKYISYYRVSTVKQNISHLGLESQKSSVELFVKNVGGEIIDSFTEVETAGSKDKISVDKQVSIESLLSKRPLLLSALKLAETNGAIIVAKESSRLTRYSLLMEFLLKSGITFEFADAPSDTAFIVKLKTSLAEEELLRISERTKAALKALKDRGFKRDTSKHGLTEENIKKGKDRRKELASLNDNNRKASGYIILLRNSGSTLQQIADKLNSEGFRSSRGKQFRPSNVLMLLNRALQTNEIIQNNI